MTVRLCCDPSLQCFNRHVYAVYVFEEVRNKEKGDFWFARAVVGMATKARQKQRHHRRESNKRFRRHVCVDLLVFVSLRFRPEGPNLSSEIRITIRNMPRWRMTVSQQIHDATHGLLLGVHCPSWAESCECKWQPLSSKKRRKGHMIESVALSIGIGEGFLYLIDRQPNIGDDDLRVIEGHWVAFPEFLDPALHHTADRSAPVIIFFALLFVVLTFIHRNGGVISLPTPS